MQEVIGPGDVVRVSAFRYPDLNTEARVAEDGRINVPMIGQVAVQGMTPQQAAKDIASRLKKGNFILDPQIDVAVIEARSRQVSVLGFVTRPGRYMLEGKAAKVTDVLAMAGGLMPEASDRAVVTRKHDGAAESFNVDVAAIIRGGDISKDVEVRSGDSIFVPKAPVVYVYGEVIRGGSYRLEPGMTVMQAISVAGGITPRGSERRVELRHKSPEGRWNEKSASLQDIVSADDVIFVRESWF
jgi:polysaccharide export outer membrane protein